MTLSCALLAGCKSSTAHQADPVPTSPGRAATASTAVPGGAQAGWIAPDDAALPAGDQAAGGHSACESDAAKIRATAKNLPRATGHDVQCLADPLAVPDIDHPGALAGYHVVADPTPASRLLSSTVLSGFQADLDAFDKAAYARAGGSAPEFVVAVATPKGSAAGLNFVGSMMTGFQATNLFAPPTVGANGRRLQLVIGCGQNLGQGRTLCAWQGTGPTPSGSQRFFGALLLPSSVDSGRAESYAEAVIAGLAPTS